MKEFFKENWGGIILGVIFVILFFWAVFGIICTEIGRPVYEVDQVLHREIFNECLKNIPKGPQSTRYNDWSEVINECNSTSYYMALKRVK